MNDWTIIGLIYDIGGVLVLGYALAITSDRQLVEQAATKWTSNPSAFDALVNQRTDAWFGVCLLVVGFSMQLLGAVGCEFLVNGWTILPVALVCLVAALLPIRKFELKRARRKRDELEESQNDESAGMT